MRQAAARYPLLKFELIAAEVRTLSHRAADAASGISDLVATSGEHLAAGVAIVRDANATLSAIVEASNLLSLTVKAISAAAAEQAIGIDELARAAGSADARTQNEAFAAQSTASATAMYDQINRLDELMEQLRTNIQDVGVLTVPSLDGCGPRHLQDIAEASHRDHPFPRKVASSRHGGGWCNI